MPGPIHRGRLSLAALLLIAAAPVYAQRPGIISGTVADASGAGMAGVAVTLARSAATLSATATTDAKGRYSFSVVPVGTYSLLFMLDGFKKLVRSNVIMTAGFVAHIDARLEPWCTTEKVPWRVFRAGGDSDNFRSTAEGKNSDADYGAFGVICGAVTDPSGAGMAGVAVTLAGGAGTPSATATTDAKGSYLFPNVSEGTYSLTFTRDGFTKSVQPNVIVIVGSKLRADQRMERAPRRPKASRRGALVETSDVAAGSLIV